MPLDVTYWTAEIDALLTMLDPYWPYMAAAISIGLAVTVTVHVAQNKQDARAAAAWTGLVWLVPVLGALLLVL